MLARLGPVLEEKMRTVKIKPKKVIAERGEEAAAAAEFLPLTLGHEIDENIREWYAALGQPVPPEEVGIGLRIEAEERGEVAAVLTAPAPAAGTAAGPKPEFGTPEFWAWARKRKKEKEAEKAVKDAEKAAAAAEKAKAAAAALAEKEAKRAKAAAEKEAAAATKAAKKTTPKK